jgi:hypothetical protein
MLECFSVMTPSWFNRAYVYTGSVGPFDRDFRYRCEQDEANRLLHAATYSRVCYELAEDAEKRDFTWDEPGVDALRQWLQSQYEAFAAKTAGARG